MLAVLRKRLQRAAGLDGLAAADLLGFVWGVGEQAERAA